MTDSPEKPSKPQAHPFENESEILAFLERPLLARLGSHNPDGSIHIAPLYFLFTEGYFLFGTQPGSRKVRNIRKDSRVSVLVDTDEPVLRSVLAYGDAALVTEKVLENRVEILKKYGRSVDNARAFARRLEKAWGSLLIRVRPDRMVTVDYSRPFTID